MFTFSFKQCRALIITVLVIVAIECIAAFPPAWVWKRLYETNFDASNDPLRLRAGIEMHSPPADTIMLLGSSRTREAYDGNAIQEYLREQCGYTGTIQNLGATGAGQVDVAFSLALVEPKRPIAVVIEPNWRLFYVDRLQTNLRMYAHSVPTMLALAKTAWTAGYLSKMRDQVAESLLGLLLPSANWFRDYSMKDIVSQILFGQPGQPVVFRYNGKASTGPPPAEIQRVIRWEKGLGMHSTTYLQKRVFEESVTAAVKRGTPVLLLDDASSPLFESLAPGDKVRQDFAGLVERLAGESGVLRPSAWPQLSADDFFDLTHVNGIGRRKLTLALAQDLEWKMRAGAIPRVSCNPKASGVFPESQP